MNATIVEYVSSIKVIKAFNQDKNFYARLSKRVRENTSYFCHCIKSCWISVSIFHMLVSTTMIIILPVEWLLYQGGNLSVRTFIFITTIILSLGIVEPMLDAIDFLNRLAKAGTIVAGRDSILGGEEQDYDTEPVVLGIPRYPHRACFLQLS